MKDLTVGRVGGHILQLSTFIALSTLFQTLYFLASGVLFVSGSVFQGLGNTLPPLGSSTLRLLLFTAIAYPLSRRPGFELRQLWYLSIATVVVQLGLNVWLLHREMGRRLHFEPAAVSPQPVAAS